MKDYYNLLGVERDADEKAIKKAYRVLANEWHPDKHQVDGEEQRKVAEEKFKQISEAYSVLSDPEKKANYDLSGDPSGINYGFRTHGDPMEFMRNFGNFSFRREPRQPQSARGQGVQLGLELGLAEALFGAEKNFQYSTNSPCDVCGTKGGTEFQTCSECKGAGHIVRQEPNMILQSTCTACRGQGQRISKTCDPCQGRGIVSEERQINVQIPPGLHNGSILRIAGAGGRGFNGGAPGDVMLQISVRYPSLEQLTEEEKAQLHGLLSKA